MSEIIIIFLSFLDTTTLGHFLGNGDNQLEVGLNIFMHTVLPCLLKHRCYGRSVVCCWLQHIQSLFLYFFLSKSWLKTGMCRSEEAHVVQTQWITVILMGENKKMLHRNGEKDSELLLSYHSVQYNIGQSVMKIESVII